MLLERTQLGQQGVLAALEVGEAGVRQIPIRKLERGLGAEMLACRIGALAAHGQRPVVLVLRDSIRLKIEFMGIRFCYLFSVGREVADSDLQVTLTVLNSVAAVAAVAQFC